MDLTQNAVYNAARIQEIFAEELAKAVAIYPECEGAFLTLNFNFGARKIGQCHILLKHIELSAAAVRLNGTEHPQIRSTIRHELAHIAAPPTARRGAFGPHGILWQRAARVLGVIKVDGDISARSSLNDTGEEFKMPESARTWKGTCPVCGRVYSRCRRPAVGKNYYCHCINLRVLTGDAKKEKVLVWERTGVREASGKVVWSI